MEHELDDNYYRSYTDKEMIDFMRKFLAENDQLPPYATIADHFGVFPNAVNERIHRLEKNGLFKRNAVNKIMFSNRKLK